MSSRYRGKISCVSDEEVIELVADISDLEYPFFVQRRAYGSANFIIKQGGTTAKPSLVRAKKLLPGIFCLLGKEHERMKRILKVYRRTASIVKESR